MTDPMYKLESIAKRIEPITGYCDDDRLVDALEADVEAMSEFRSALSGVTAEPFYKFVEQSEYGSIIVEAVDELGLLPTDSRNFMTSEQLQSTTPNQMLGKLCGACIVNDTRAVQFFAAQIDVNALNHHEQSPLSYAVGNNHIECVRILLRHGANPNRVQKWGNTPLHICASGISSKEIFELLIDAGGDLTIRNGAGKTPVEAMGRKRRQDWGI